MSIVSNPRAGLLRIRGLTSGRGKTSLVHCVQTGFAALAACIQTVLRAVSADMRRQARISAQSLPSTAGVKGPIHSKLNCPVSLCKKTARKTELNVFWHSTGFPSGLPVFLSVLCVL